MIDLSMPLLFLPDISETPECRKFSELALRTKEMAGDGAAMTRGFKIRVKRLQDLVNKGADVSEHLDSMADVRPVIHLWQTDAFFLEKQPVSKKMLLAFSHLSPSLGTLAMAQLIRLYFDMYDLLKLGKEPLRRFLETQVALRRGRPLAGDLKKLTEYQLVLLHKNAPSELVTFCLKRGYPLDRTVKKIGVPSGVHNRFLTVCMGIYYLETLKKLSHGEDSPAFDEITRQTVYDLPYADRRLGHAVIEMLIDRCLYAELELPDNWRDVILSIAKDPRVPQSHENFIKWWSVLTHERTQWMQQWLSKIDLELFLVILNEYARTSGNDVIERMFPARARFLEGLHNAGYIKSSRLFLGSDASHFLLSRFNGRILPNYASLNTASKAIVYFKVDHIHCIDGTHSFPLLMFETLPQQTPIGDFRDIKFSEKSLNQAMIDGYGRLRSQGEAESEHVRIVHHPNIGWQHKAIEAFRHFGVIVDPATVLTDHDHDTYLRKYSL